MEKIFYGTDEKNVFWKKEQACAFTGHRYHQLPFEKNSLEEENFLYRLEKNLDKQISQGIQFFLTGMATGADTLLGELVREKRKEKNLFLIAVLPYEGQSRSWSGEDQKRYEALLRASDCRFILSKQWQQGAYHMRNRFMVDNACHLLAGYDGREGGGTGYTVAYGRKKGRTIHVVPPMDPFWKEELWKLPL